MEAFGSVWRLRKPNLGRFCTSTSCRRQQIPGSSVTFQGRSEKSKALSARRDQKDADCCQHKARERLTAESFAQYDDAQHRGKCGAAESDHGRAYRKIDALR